MQCKIKYSVVKRCCCITVDPEMRTSQNVCFLGTFLGTRHKKTIITQNMTRNIILLIAFIFYQRAVVKQNCYMTLLLNYSNTVPKMQPLQNTPLCGSTVQTVTSTTAYETNFILFRKYPSESGTIQ